MVSSNYSYSIMIIIICTQLYGFKYYYLILIILKLFNPIVEPLQALPLQDRDIETSDLPKYAQSFNSGKS